MDQEQLLQILHHLIGPAIGMTVAFMVVGLKNIVSGVRANREPDFRNNLFSSLMNLLRSPNLWDYDGHRSVTLRQDPGISLSFNKAETKLHGWETWPTKNGLSNDLVQITIRDDPKSTALPNSRCPKFTESQAKKLDKAARRVIHILQDRQAQAIAKECLARPPFRPA